MIFNPRVVQLTGARIALAAPSNFAASPGNESVSLTWTDPGDETSGGQVVASWEFTRIVRKVGSPPVNETDGTVVLESNVKNQYMSTPYVDTGLTNGTTYYYGAFACSVAGAWSDGAFAGAIPVAGTPLGELAEGTLINIQESGQPVQFYVAKVGYEPTLNGPNRVLMVRKDVYDHRQWHSSRSNIWATSTMLSWLNGDYKNLFSSNVQGFMGETTYEYTPGNGNWNVTTRSDPVFLMSMTELGRTPDYLNVEGSYLPISSTLEFAYQNGSPTTQWTRSPDTRGNLEAAYINPSGIKAVAYCTDNRGSRPCFTLPTNALVDPDLNLIENSDIPPIETPLGDLVEGTLITVKENGAPVEFYVAKQNYEEGLNGAGRVLCVRKDCYDKRPWNQTVSNAYATSDIDNWLNSTYKLVFSNVVQSLIGNTVFEFIPGQNDYNVTTLQRSVFLLSATELADNHSLGGTGLPIYRVLEIANYQGSPVDQWTRTPRLNETGKIYILSSIGGLYDLDCSDSRQVYSRPCFTLPASALVDGNLALIEEV